MEYLNLTFGGNTLKEWATAMGIAIVAFILMWLAKKALARSFSKRADRDSLDIYALISRLAQRIQLPLITVFAVYFGLQSLKLPEGLSPWLSSIAMAALIMQLTLWATSLVDHYLKRSQRRYAGIEKNAGRITTLRTAGVVMKVVLAAIAAVLILDNIPGVQITALVASLGITGIAVALAVQNILSDLFGSLSIVLDKPFLIGDFIIVDDYMGSVENIGLKTTRIRSLSGEQLVFSNNDLLKSRIRNYKRMDERRVVFSFGVTYETPLEKLREIPATVRRIIEPLEAVRFDRAHFQEYGDFSLNFEVVYYVLDSDYNRYMDIQQSINLTLYAAFEEKQIDFAYPTRTLYINNGDPQGRTAAADGQAT